MCDSDFKHTSCLLIKWNSEEKRKYMRTNIDQYPPVVTQNQINILLLQTLMEVLFRSLYFYE